jgi:peptidyl-prolyl cis-trans isomerase B (cyclophilin B)
LFGLGKKILSAKEEMRMKYLWLLLLLLVSACGADDTPQEYIPPPYEPAQFTQLRPPLSGEPIATIHTSKGDIVIRLFPQYAPLTVGNFIAMAEAGWYDGVPFYRVVPQFLIQAGIPGDSSTIHGGPFEREWDTPLHHIRGAVGASTTPMGAFSHFYIIQNSDMDYETEMSPQFREIIANPDMLMEDMYGVPFIPITRIPVPFLEYYLEHGGMWRLDYPGLGYNTQRMPLFGQVVSGMEVVDAIAAVENTGADTMPPNMPLTEVYILHVTIGTMP